MVVLLSCRVEEAWILVFCISGFVDNPVIIGVIAVCAVAEISTQFYSESRKVLIYIVIFTERLLAVFTCDGIHSATCPPYLSV